MRDNFNDLKFLVNKRVPAKHYKAQFDERFDASRRRYLKSPAYKEYRKWETSCRERYQHIVDKVESKLDEIIHGDPYSLVKGIYPLICSLDFVGVKVNYSKLVQALEGSGYVNGEGVGAPSYDRDSGGRYVIGQVISLIHHNPVYLGSPCVRATHSKIFERL